MICLDTNVVIGYLGGKPANLVAHFEREILQTAFHLPVIAFFELRYGIAKSARGRENIERLALFLQLPITILAFEPEDAEEAGDIRAQLERAGTPIGPYDILIAAQARRRNATLVTANTSEFTRVPGLRTQGWATEWMQLPHDCPRFRRRTIMDRQRFENVWDALEDTPAEAANMTLRSRLLIAIEARVRSWNVTQAEAPRRLGITQPRVNDLLRGKIANFNVDTLIGLAAAVGLAVRIDIEEAA